MPIHIVLSTPQEVFAEAVSKSKELSEKILKLSNLNDSPLMPGETADTRRHQIAKFGKALAEAFMVINNLIEHAHAVAVEHARRSDITSGPIGEAAPDAGKSDPDPNAN